MAAGGIPSHVRAEIDKSRTPVCATDVASGAVRGPAIAHFLSRQQSLERHQWEIAG